MGENKDFFRSKDDLEKFEQALEDLHKTYDLQAMREHSLQAGIEIKKRVEQLQKIYALGQDEQVKSNPFGTGNIQQKLAHLNQPNVNKPVMKPDVWSNQIAQRPMGSGLMGSKATPKRVGTFSLEGQDVMNMDYSVMAVMTRCCVVRAESDIATGLIQYVALSPMFDELEPGQRVPTYVWEVNGNNLIARKL